MADSVKERCVLLPVDRSRHSERAVMWYLQSGCKPNDHLYLYHSVDTSGIIPTFVPGPTAHANVEAQLKEIDCEVQELKKKYEKLLLGHNLKTDFYYTSRYSAPGEGPIPSANIEALLKEKEMEVRDLKKKYEQILHGHHLKAEFVSSSSYSHPGEGVVHFCKEKKIDYIVMGSRGMGSIRRTFLGSVSDFVLHHVHLPITIIPPEAANENGASHH